MTERATAPSGPERSDEPPSPLKKVLSWRLLLSLGITLAVIVLVFRLLAGGLDELGPVLAEARWSWLPIPFLLLGINLALAVARWRTLVVSMGYRLSYGRTLYAVLSTWPFVVLTPSRASDLLRALVIRDRAPVWAGAGSVLAEKLIDIQSLCLLATCGAVVSGQWVWVLPAVGVLGAEWLCVALLFHRRAWFLGLPVVNRVSGKLTQALSALDALRKRPGAFVVVSGLSIGSWLCATGVAAALLYLFAVDLPFTLVLTGWPLATFIGLLPLTLAGMGTRDAAFVGFVQATGAATDAAPMLAATLAFSLVNTWTLVVVGLPVGVHLLWRGFPPETPSATER